MRKIPMERSCKRCGVKFWPRIRTQRYCSLRCKNQQAQKRLRERAKIASH